jgi:hypothetical protein
VPAVSLHTIVSDGLAGRFPQPPATTVEATERPNPLGVVRLTGMSMRLLETGLAFTAIATALLIGLGR